ncbi:MAG: RibD family protein [Turneriella sp.]|nr:RibD family protein [Turneriella sp.]
MAAEIGSKPKTGRVHVRLNMATTLDGHVAYPGRAWDFGSAEDRRRMDRLREWADCLIVSRKTLEHDDMNLTVRTKPHAKKHPRPVIVMQSPRPMRPGLRILKNSHIEGEIWLQGKAAETTINELWPDLGQPWRIHPYMRVDEIIASLAERGFKKILLEGGPTLNGVFFAANLVDEFFLTLLPILWAGTTTDRTVISAEQLPLHRFRLKSAEKRRNEMFLRYVKLAS